MAISQERSITIKTSTILKVLAILFALGLLWLIRDIIALLIVALFLAALMHPAARWGARYRIPKGVTVLVIYLGLFSSMAVVIALIIPALVQQFAGLSQTIGSSLQMLSESVQNLRAFSELHGISGSIASNVPSMEDQFTRAASGLFSTLTDIFGGIAGLIIVLVMAFYMVVQDRDAIRLFKNLVPNKYQDLIANVLLQVEDKIGGWLRGQLFLSLLIGILYYVGLLIIGVKSPLVLALFAGFTEFIPYLGPILSGIPIMIIAVSQSPFTALLVFGLVILIQQLENQIIVPKVMQKAVGLSPLVSIVAVLVGVKLFGIVGALLAIPVTTALSVVLMELYRVRQDQA